MTLELTADLTTEQIEKIKAAKAEREENDKLDKQIAILLYKWTEKEHFAHYKSLETYHRGQGWHDQDGKMIVWVDSFQPSTHFEQEIIFELNKLNHSVIFQPIGRRTKVIVSNKTIATSAVHENPAKALCQAAVKMLLKKKPCKCQK